MTGSEDGTIKIYDVRIPGIQRDYTPDPKSPINGVIIHPNQGACCLYRLVFIVITN